MSKLRKLKEVRADDGQTAQSVSTIILIVAQALFVSSILYWFGFSSISGLNVIQHLSLVQVVTSIMDARLSYLLITIPFIMIIHTHFYDLRRRSIGFIDDLSIKVPPHILESGRVVIIGGSASLDAGERHMTQRELEYFVKWIKNQKFARIMSIVTFTLSILMIVYLWRSGNRMAALNLGSISVLSLSILIAVSNVLAFISLSLRALFASLLSLYYISIMLGALDAHNLLHSGESSNFPQADLKFENQTILGQVIMQNSSNILIMDTLRRFTLIPNSKVSEITYTRH